MLPFSQFSNQDKGIFFNNVVPFVIEQRRIHTNSRVSVSLIYSLISVAEVLIFCQKGLPDQVKTELGIYLLKDLFVSLVTSLLPLAFTNPNISPWPAGKSIHKMLQ